MQYSSVKEDYTISLSLCKTVCINVIICWHAPFRWTYKNQIWHDG